VRRLESGHAAGNVYGSQSGVDWRWHGRLQQPAVKSVFDCLCFGAPCRGADTRLPASNRLRGVCRATLQ
jgi:hypothetical protein